MRERLDRHVNGAQLVRFPFAFDTPGLTDGVPVYTPAPGDVLLEAWIEVAQAWDGVTPQADIGTFVGSATGLFAVFTSQVQLNFPDTEPGGSGLRVNTLEPPLTRSQATARVAPAKFTAVNPLKLVVSQDATLGGAGPGATQGEATLFLLVAPA